MYVYKTNILREFWTCHLFTLHMHELHALRIFRIDEILLEYPCYSILGSTSRRAWHLDGHEFEKCSCYVSYLVYSRSRFSWKRKSRYISRCAIIIALSYFQTYVFIALITSNRIVLMMFAMSLVDQLHPTQYILSSETRHFFLETRLSLPRFLPLHVATSSPAC